MPGTGTQLTPRDVEVLAATWKCFTTPIEIKASTVDFEKLAQETGLKNAESAKTTLRNARKKLDNASLLPNDSPKRKGSSSTKDGDAASKGSPAKKPRTKRGAAKASKEALNADDNSDQDSNKVKVKDDSDHESSKIKAEGVEM